MNVAFPCVQMCKCQEFDISCISLHEILYFLHHDLILHKFSGNGFCEISCDTFQSSHNSVVYLKLMVTLVPNTSVWPFLAMSNFL